MYAAEAPELPDANWIIASAIATTVELTLVVVPPTVKSPVSVKPTNVGEAPVPMFCTVLSVTAADSAPLLATVMLLEPASAIVAT